MQMARPESQRGVRHMSGKREEAARRRVLANAEALGLSGHLLELETQGFTVLKSALTPAQVERAKTSILSRVEAATGCAIDPQASLRSALCPRASGHSLAPPSRHLAHLADRHR